jgi:hypothetical protein
MTSGCVSYITADIRIPSKTEVKLKVKFTLQQAKQAQRKNRGIALLFI